MILEDIKYLITKKTSFDNGAIIKRCLCCDGINKSENKSINNNNKDNDNDNN